MFAVYMNVSKEALEEGWTTKTAPPSCSKGMNQADCNKKTATRLGGSFLVSN